MAATAEDQGTDQAPPPPNPQREHPPLLEGVQCLRFLAAILVVVTHSTFYASDRLDASLVFWPRGVVGVDIFFVISGLVMFISSQPLQQRRDGWREFAVRRLVRVAPLYWLVTTINLVVLLLAPAMVKHSVLDWPYIIKSYLFIPAYNQEGRIEPLVGVGWTLIFEMFFYSIFAISMLLRLRVLPVATAVLALCGALSLVRSHNWPAFSLFFDPRALEFIAGMLMGRWLSKLKGPMWVGLTFFGLGLAALLFLPWTAAIPHRILTHVLPSAAVVLGVTMLEPHFAGRWPRLLVFLGAMSYSLYLTHPLVAPIVPTVLARMGLIWPWASVAGSVVLALLVANGCYRLFEKPVTDRLNRILKKRSGAAWNVMAQTTAKVRT